MKGAITIGQVVRERRNSLGLTQSELAGRVGCAAITIRKIEADDLRPSVQMAELIAVALNVPEEEQLAFVRLARAEKDPSPLPTPSPLPSEIGLSDLSGRAVKGFHLGEKIGSGGHGVVYRALQPPIDREVAVKIILPRYANHPNFIRRFEAEAQLIAQLEHPHIVPLYDYWREPSAAYLIMRFFRSGSLEDQLKKGPLSLQLTHHYMQQIGLALDLAHRNGIIHRDIKPANLLLDEEGNAYLADFGIAKNLNVQNNQKLTQNGALIGSPAYISPEQIKDEPMRPQSDIYCLGIILFEMLTGQKPFTGPTTIAFFQQHLNDPVPLLQTYDPQLPKELDDIIFRATARNVADRYKNVSSLLQDLQETLFKIDSRIAMPLHGERPVVLNTAELENLENPYKGLRSFKEADAEQFYGRNTLIQELLTLLSDQTDLARFLAVVGPSGSGKSSVVKAGLVPALRRGALPGSENWFVVDIAPGAHPWEEVEAALLRVAVNPPETLLNQLQEGDRGLLRAVNRILPDDGQTELLLVIDQFEELFTLVAGDLVREQFLNSLITAVLDDSSRLRIALTLRADFYDRPLEFVDFGDLLRQRSVSVLPMTPDELEQAISRPALGAGLRLETGLVETIIRDVGDQPGTLPLLQYVLTELFEQREGNAMTKFAYAAAGGVSGALTRRADSIYQSLNDDGQTATRQLFLRLITLGEGVEDTRRRVRLSELESLANQRIPDTKYQELIAEYGRYRLLTFDRDPITREPTVEVAHEVLLREWSRLSKWLAESRDDIRRQRLLAVEAAHWQDAGQDASYLLLGNRLVEFSAWADSTKLSLTGEERSFLQASLEARQQREAEEQARQARELETLQKLSRTERKRAEEQARTNQRLRFLVTGLACVLLLALVLGWMANDQRLTAQDNFIEAERTRLAAQAQIALDRGEDVVLPALLALRSLQFGYSPEADAALLSALRRGFARQIFVGHTDALASADFSPDGQQVLTAGNDTTARLWDAQTGQEIRRFIGHTELVSRAYFMPDGKHILTSSADRTVRLWDAVTGQEVGRLPEHRSPVWALAISPDGQTVLTSDESGSAWLWDLQSMQIVHELSGHGDIVLHGSFSPNGRTVVTGSLDKTARLWDVTSGQEMRGLEGHAAAVSSVAFSPDGRFLATASHDNTARIWDVETGEELRQFIGHDNIVWHVVFSPDGRFLATASQDNTARIWDVETSEELRQFIGHTAIVNAIEFSPDGQQVLTSSVDRTARLWDISLSSEPRIFSRPFRTIHGNDVIWTGFSTDGEQLLLGNRDGSVQVRNIQSGQISGEPNLEIEGLITDLIFSADNAYALTAGGDGLAQLWDVESGAALFQLLGHAGAVGATAFSPDSALVVTGSEDGIAKVWQTQNGTEQLALTGHGGPVRAVAFSPDGRLLLTGGDDGLARLWAVETGQEIRQLSGHNGSVLDVAFSPDGRSILTGGSDRTARLWEVESGRILRSFVGHTDQVRVVVFSPDGRHVLTGSDDHTARMWDAASGRVVRQFFGHGSPLSSIAFSPDGNHVLTGDLERAYLWQRHLAKVVAMTCAQLPRDFTAEERSLYSIADDAPTCTELAALDR